MFIEKIQTVKICINDTLHVKKKGHRRIFEMHGNDLD